MTSHPGSLATSPLSHGSPDGTARVLDLGDKLITARSATAEGLMSGEQTSVSPDFIASVQPIVLVGGKSRRFGRDKLCEPWGEPGGVLVQRPIEVLRSIFGPRVKLVGECDPRILPLADGVIIDEHPGVGPIGGIISALKLGPGSVFVLAGDMPNVLTGDVLRTLCAAQQATSAFAALATTDRIHPCAGIYFHAALPSLLGRLSQGAFRLTTALPNQMTVAVPWSSRSAANVNALSELGVLHRPQEQYELQEGSEQ